MFSAHREPHTIYDSIRSGANNGPIYQPPCECDECRNHFRWRKDQQKAVYSHHEAVSDANATMYVDGMRNATLSLYSETRDLVHKHGDTILGRWRNAKQEKRKVLIKQADVAPENIRRWILPQAIFCSKPGMGCTQHATKKELLPKNFYAPFINTETLSSGVDNFIGLMYHGVKFPPHSWASFDFESTKFQWDGGVKKVPFNRNAVSMCATNYGTLVPWNADMAHRRDIIGYPRAYPILQAQYRNLLFLNGIVKLLCDNLGDKNQSGCSKLDEYINGGLCEQGEKIPWSIYTNQPSTHPLEADLSEMLAISEARQRRSQDQIWIYKSDSAILRRWLRLYKTSLSPTVFDMSDIYIDCTTKPTNDLLGAWDWQLITHELRYVYRLHIQYKNIVEQGRPLPREYDDALGALDVLLYRELLSTLSNFRSLLIWHPSFGKGRKTLFKGFGIEEYHDDPLYWCLAIIAISEHEPRGLSLSYLFSFLDHHLSNAKKDERNRVDEMVSERLDKIAALGELQARLHMHRPMFRSQRKDGEKKFDSIQRPAWRYHNYPKYLNAESQEPKLMAVGEKLRAFDLLHVPAGQVNQEWLNQHDRVQNASTQFWNELCNFLDSCLAPYEPNDLIRRRFLISHFEIDDEIRQEQRGERAGYVGRAESHGRASAKSKSISPLPHGPSSSLPAPKLDLAASGKEKVKSRPAGQQPGTAVGNVAPAGPAPAQQEPEPQRPTITLTKGENLNIFHQMYPSTAEERAYNSIGWLDFVRAMEDAGFGATSAGGSAVSFRSLREQRIVFHRPHGHTDRITKEIFLSHGKRLSKSFGWSRETFCLLEDTLGAVALEQV